MTSVGVVPLHESNLPSKQFNFWVAFTNFRIAPKVPAICNIAGVEAFEAISPYRFRIAVAKLFNENEVKRAIEEAVADGPSPAVNAIGRTMAKYYECWAVGKDERGRLKHFGGRTQQEVEGQMKGRNLSGVITSWTSN